MENLGRETLSESTRNVWSMERHDDKQLLLDEFLFFSIKIRRFNKRFTS